MSIETGLLDNIFEKNWRKESWYHIIDQYMISRFTSIEERFIETARYVEIHPFNRFVCSYEYSSILRDAGSIFDSVMRKFLEETGFPKLRNDYDIRDYRKFLRCHVPNIESLVAKVQTISNHDILIPFIALQNGKAIDWWKAYNNIKHSDIDERREGNLLNCLNSLAAIGIIFKLMNQFARFKLFSQISYGRQDIRNYLMFSKSPRLK